METPTSPLPPKKIHPVTTMTFADAMKAVLEGKKVARVEWGSEDTVFLQGGLLHIKNDKGTHQLVVGEGDLVAEDWIIKE